MAGHHAVGGQWSVRVVGSGCRLSRGGVVQRGKPSGTSTLPRQGWWVWERVDGATAGQGPRSMHDKYSIDSLPMNRRLQCGGWGA